MEGMARLTINIEIPETSENIGTPETIESRWERVVS